MPADVNELPVAAYILKTIYHDHILLERIGGVDKDGKEINRWAIRDRGSLCLSKRRRWDIEPSPSNRSDKYIQTHRWDDPNAAYNFWLKFEAKQRVKERIRILRAASMMGAVG
jgi:hypothetical protein